MKATRFLFVEIFLDSRVGRCLLEPYYRFMAWIVCCILEWRFPSVKAWTRNSLKSKDIIPGISDIDLTIYSYSVMTREQEIFLRELHQGLKLIIPILGEWNTYYDEDRDVLHNLFNCYELSRDPMLERIIGKREQRSQSELKTYLLRQWHSDQHYLKRVPELRRKKWKRIADRTDTQFQEITAEGVKRAIENVVCANINDDESLICFYPHEWIGQNWHQKNFKESFESLKNFSLEHQAVCISQINWEVCGILCQMPFIDNPSDMVHHFDHLGRMLKTFSNEDGLSAELEIAKDRIRDRYAQF